eukprot:UN25653
MVNNMYYNQSNDPFVNKDKIIKKNEAILLPEIEYIPLPDIDYIPIKPQTHLPLDTKPPPINIQNKEYQIDNMKLAEMGVGLMAANGKIDNDEGSNMSKLNFFGRTDSDWKQLSDEHFTNATALQAEFQELTQYEQKEKVQELRQALAELQDVVYDYDLTVVIATRNDNYGGDSTRRLRFALNQLYFFLGKTSV